VLPDSYEEETTHGSPAAASQHVPRLDALYSTYRQHRCDAGRGTGVRAA
jgi:hypothetical protein